MLECGFTNIFTMYCKENKKKKQNNKKRSFFQKERLSNRTTVTNNAFSSLSSNLYKNVIKAEEEGDFTASRNPFNSFDEMMAVLQEA